METPPDCHQRGINHDTRDRPHHATGVMVHGRGVKAGNEAGSGGGRRRRGGRVREGEPDRKTTSVIAGKMLVLAAYKTIMRASRVRGDVS